MTEEWATCIDCGWTGLVKRDITACPWCGYMVHINIPLTEKEKDEIVESFASGGFYCSRQFITKYNKWKR